MPVAVQWVTEDKLGAYWVSVGKKVMAEEMRWRERGRAPGEAKAKAAAATEGTAGVVGVEARGSGRKGDTDGGGAREQGSSANEHGRAKRGATEEIADT